MEYLVRTTRLGLARNSDPATSKQAAATLPIPALEQAVLRELWRLGDKGATSHELAASLNMDRVTVSPRLRPLANKGLIEESEDRRLGPTGRSGIVWRAII